MRFPIAPFESLFEYGLIVIMKIARAIYSPFQSNQSIIQSIDELSFPDFENEQLNKNKLTAFFRRDIPHVHEN